MNKREAATIAILLVTVFACSSFKYKYYGIHPSKSLLLGSKPEYDLPLTVCEPDEWALAFKVKGKCVVIFVDEFERIRADMKSLEEQLKACQEQQS